MKRHPDAPRLLAVDGPAGVGKGALIRHWAERTGAKPVTLEQNPFMDEVFTPGSRRAFSAEMFFLLARHRKLKRLRQEDLFSERRVLSGLLTGSRAYASVLLSPSEFELYDRIYSMLEPQAVVPDVVIVLRAPPAGVMKRLSARAVEGAPAISIETVEDICRAFAHQYADWRRSRVLFVDVDDIDLYHSREIVERIAERTHIVGRELPLGERAAYDPISEDYLRLPKRSSDSPER